MQTQLPYGTATYPAIFNVAVTNSMPSTGRKHAVVHGFEDGRIRVKNLSSTFFDITIQFENITAADRDFIFDFYHNTAKADGSKNTFYFQNPLDDYVYVARFLTPLTTVFRSGNLQSVDVIKLRISAFYGIATPTYTDMSIYVEPGYVDI